MERIPVQRNGRVSELALSAQPRLNSVGTGWAGPQLELHRMKTIDRVGRTGPPEGEHGLMVVVRGKLSVVGRGASPKHGIFEGGPGGVLFLSGSSPHDVERIVGDADVAAIRLTAPWFHRLGLAEVPARFGALPYRPHDATVLALLGALLQELRAGAPTGPLYAESLSTALLSYLLHEAALKHEAPDSGGLSRTQCHNLHDYISSRLGHAVSLGALAKVVGMSPRKLTDSFRRAFGMSPYAYVVRERIRVAQTALVQGEWSVGQAAQQLGFSDVSHFSRTFKRLVGATPTQYVRDGEGRGLRAVVPIGRRGPV